jgi:hypothetical protein
VLNFDEYVYFVVGAKIAGQEIDQLWKDNLNCTANYKKQLWNWELYCYCIKLPEGWEYVTEDGDIAFREVDVIEDFLGCSASSYKPTRYHFSMGKILRPIIRKINNK